MANFLTDFEKECRFIVGEGGGTVLAAEALAVVEYVRKLERQFWGLDSHGQLPDSFGVRRRILDLIDEGPTRPE